MLSALEREMVAAAAQAGRRGAEDDAPYFRPGIVIASDPANTAAQVAADGSDGTPFPARIASPVTLFPGDRVLLMFVRPTAVYVMGRLTGDMGDWREVGDIDSSFATGWQADSGTTPPGFGGPATPMFTRRSGLIELRGRAVRVSGSSTTVFTLPEDCWPGNDLLVPALTTLGAHTPLTITNLGVVSVASGVTEIIMDGVSYHARVPEDAEA